MLASVRAACAVLGLAGVCAPLQVTWAQEWHGLLDLRLVAADGNDSWTRAGTGKSRYDAHRAGFGVGQAVLQGTQDLPGALSATASFSASDQHPGVLDVREAWLGWNPVPSSAWSWRAKAGAFFPPSSVEIGYEGIGWTPLRTVSSSAINSWIGEELRSKGVEVQLARNGRQAGSPHSYQLNLALFQGNDPTGTLLAWRGWSVSDRIAGLNEPMSLPDLPIYRKDGAIPRQTREIHPFREVDGRLGYYGVASYRYRDRLEFAWLHYDNRADPLVVKQGQYGWHTRFDHWSVVARPGGGWELLAQYMRGSTVMGPDAVALDFRAWYALLSHPVGPGQLALRFDRFGTTDHDLFPADPNGERGHAVALAYSTSLPGSALLVSELLLIDSDRAARQLLGDRPHRIERTWMTSLRWQF